MCSYQNSFEKIFRIFPASCNKIFRFFVRKLALTKNSQKILRIWIFQSSRHNLTNFLTNFGTASWTKFRVSSIGSFDMSTFQKSKNLVKILRNFSENFIDRTKPCILTCSADQLLITILWTISLIENIWLGISLIKSRL